MSPRSNFRAWLTDERGKYVPYSLRVGHNVFTDFGKEWLRDVVVWALLGDSEQGPSVSNSDNVLDAPDPGAQPNPKGGRRIRWIGVGTGSQLEVPSIVRLDTPLVISGSDYIKTINGGLVFPTPASTKYTATFSGGDFGGDFDISEAAIYVDVDDGASPLLDPTDISNVPVAYRSFGPLNKLLAQTLTIVWEFRF